MTRGTTMPTTTLYKALGADGRSCHGGGYAWRLRAYLDGTATDEEVTP